LDFSSTRLGCKSGGEKEGSISFLKKTDKALLFLCLHPVTNGAQHKQQNFFVLFF